MRILNVVVSRPLMGLLAGIALMATAVPSPCAAQSPTTIAVVNDKAKFDLRASGHALFVRVSVAGVARLEARTAEIAGGLIPAAAVTFDAADGTFAEGAWVALPLRIDAGLVRELGPGSHEVSARVDARDAGGKLLATAAATFSLVRTERQLLPQATPVALGVRRAWPFTAVGSTHCLQLHASPPGPTAVPAIDPGELYAGAGANKMIVAGALVEGHFGPCPTASAAPAASAARPAATSPAAAGGAGAALGPPPPLVLESTLPAGVTTATATLRLRGPDLKPDSALTVQIYSKDWLIWPLIAVALATLLSWRVHSWLESGRSSAINVADMSQMADELHNLRRMKPAVEKKDGYREVQRLLATAARQQERGDVQGCAATLVTAREKLDALITAADAPEGGVLGAAARALEFGQPAMPAIVVETPAGERTTGRVLVFSVSNMPDPATTIRWEIAIDDEWRTLDVAPEAGVAPAGSRVTTRAPIREAGVYAVRVDVDGQVTDSVTFRVAPSGTVTTLAAVRKTDASIDLIAVALTALITTVAIWELDSFGTFRDYALQFTGAFGITESIKGFSQLLGAVRKA